MKINKLKKEIENILAEYPETRNDDIELMIKLWVVYYPQFIKNNIGVLLQDLKKLPREDHIKRYRAKIQNEELKYLPTKLEVLEHRLKSAKKWREKLGYPETYKPHIKEEEKIIESIINHLKNNPFSTPERIIEL